MSLLKVTDLTVCYPGHAPALDGVSLSIDASDIVGLSGPSGCGKTTLAMAIMGLLSRDAAVSGSIRFRGRELRTLSDRELQPIRGAGIGVVFQESALALNPLRTAGAHVVDVVRAHTRCSKTEASRHAAELLAAVGLGGETSRVFRSYPHELSGGQRQRILIAQAIACRPALLIADEPVASLDALTRDEMLALIRSLNAQRSISVLLITHSAEVLATTAHRTIRLDAGRIVTSPRPVRTVPALSASAAPRPAESARAQDPIVQVAGLRKRYQRQPLFGRRGPAVDALKDVDLTIGVGRTLGLAGLSGCGKSTLARCLAGLERPDAGHIRIAGTEISQLSEGALRPIRNLVQIVFQDSAAALNPRFSALEIVSEPMVIQRVGTAAHRREWAAELMTQVGLPTDRLTSRPGTFSGGERQRLAIARALSVGPRLLILDEAFSGLDAATRERIVSLLSDLQARHGLSYLCISHDLELLSHLAPDILLMDAGTLVDRGTTAQPLLAGAAA